MTTGTTPATGTPLPARIGHCTGCGGRIATTRDDFALDTTPGGGITLRHHLCPRPRTGGTELLAVAACTLGIAILIAGLAIASHWGL